jgi:HEPN domain-containing protein
MSKTQKIHNVVKQWLEHAEEDLRLAKHAFRLSSSCPYKLIAFHAQQCAEKYLKAFLALKKVDFPYTHNISLLLELSSEHATWVKDLREAEILTDYAVTTRYPGAEKVTKKDAELAVKTAVKVRNVVRKALKQEGLNLP